MGSRDLMPVETREKNILIIIYDCYAGSANFTLKIKIEKVD